MSTPPKTNRNVEQSEATQRALLVAARELFAGRGYAGTYTDEIARQAGVTRGALYHQFRDKKAVFRAVAAEIAEETVARIRDLSRPQKPEGVWARLTSSAEHSLDIFQDPAVRQVLLIDAPSVLGWEDLRALEAETFVRHIVRALEAAMDNGDIEVMAVEPLANLLLAVVISAALDIAHAEDPDRTREDMRRAVARIHDGLRAPVPSRGRRRGVAGGKGRADS